MPEYGRSANPKILKGRGKVTYDWRGGEGREGNCALSIRIEIPTTRGCPAEIREKGGRVTRMLGVGPMLKEAEVS